MKLNAPNDKPVNLSASANDLYALPEPSPNELRSIEDSAEVEEPGKPDGYDPDAYIFRLCHHDILTREQEREKILALQSDFKSYAEVLTLVGLASKRIAQVGEHHIRRNLIGTIGADFFCPQAVVETMPASAQRVYELFHINAALSSLEKPSPRTEKLIDSNARASQQQIFPWQPNRKTLDMRLYGDDCTLGVIRFAEKFRELQALRKRSAIDSREYSTQCAHIIEETGMIPEKLLELVDAAKQERERYDSKMDNLLHFNFRLVKKEARKHLQRKDIYCNYQDLFQVGCLSFIRGVEGFDLTRGYKLSTYALWWVRQGISREIENARNGIRLPVHVSEKLSAINKAINRIRQRESIDNDEPDYHPSGEEIALELGYTGDSLQKEAASIEKVLRNSRTVVSLDASVNGETEDNREAEDNRYALKGDESAKSPVNEAHIAGLHGRIEALLSTLNNQQKNILEQRFGLIDGIPHTLEEVGAQYKVTRERIRQIQEKALKRLRHPTRLKFLGISKEEFARILS